MPYPDIVGHLSIAGSNPVQRHKNRWVTWMTDQTDFRVSGREGKNLIGSIEWARKLPRLTLNYTRVVNHNLVSNSQWRSNALLVILSLLFGLGFLNVVMGQLPGFREVLRKLLGIVFKVDSIHRMWLIQGGIHRQQGSTAIQ